MTLSLRVDEGRDQNLERKGLVLERVLGRMRLQSCVLSVETTSSGTDFDPELELRFPTLAAHVVSLLRFYLQYSYSGSMLTKSHSSSSRRLQCTGITGS